MDISPRSASLDGSIDVVDTYSKPDFPSHDLRPAKDLGVDNFGFHHEDEDTFNSNIPRVRHQVI